MVDTFLTKTSKGFRPNELYYQLSLSDKYQVVRDLEEQERLHDIYLYDALVLGILQHSPPDSKKQWKVNKERKLNSNAKHADETEAYQALYMSLDKVFIALENMGIIRGAQTDEEII